ncbi:hypothetical protein [Sediminitomix flava]|uniref:Phosphate-selective porin O/P n=1 Tax=Sediminitomix flava TaxID=379075 RepID=A0A315ZAP3_SEDFL|nr:hypothetical protein [Sediminitomix flava]PWJ42420.1 hypothetical protein BC781_103672 [Sediminitomix flava]
MKPKIINLPILITFILLSFSLISIGKPLQNLNDTIPEKATTIQVGPKSEFTLGGAVWLRSALQNWEQSNQANQRGFYFDQFRISVNGNYGIEKNTFLKFSAQVRWWSYQFAVHHMWVGVEFDKAHTLRYGITEAPFGAMPSISSSFWYSLNYYLGMESDHDAGLHYIYKKGPIDLQLAYFRNEEYNIPTATNRWAPDLVINGDQQNFERNQLNARFAYTFGYDTENKTEIGISGEVGAINNQVERGDGFRWASALHYVGNYGQWNPYAQFLRYEFEPNNPEGVDDRTVLLGFFSDQRLIASKAFTVVGGLRKYWDINWWLFDNFSAYIEYSGVYKDESSFSDSQIINPGFVLQAGPFYIWTDFMAAQNAWFFNDSFENSGLGAGSADSNAWEFRYNFSLEWYF